MTTTPVHKLKIAGSTDAEPVEIDLPWELFSEVAKKTLDELDRDDSGDILYLTDPSASTFYKQPEISHADGSAEQFMRLFWAYSGDFPNNNFSVDNDPRLLADRNKAVLALQDAMFEKVAAPLLLEDLKNIENWRKAKGILMTVADARHLYEMSRLLMTLWGENSDKIYLELAEEYLLEAIRFASEPRGLRDEWLSKINAAYKVVGNLLDCLEEKEFAREIKEPYVMATMGSPVTGNISPATSENPRVAIRVALPANFPVSTLLDYFNKTHPLSARLSPFKGVPGGGRFDLTAVAVLTEEEAASQLDDFNSLIRRESTDGVLFGGKRNYVHVVFEIPKAMTLLESAEARKFDLILRDGLAEKKILPGALVLQDKNKKDVRIAFASDIHVSERDYLAIGQMAASLQAAAKEKDANKRKSEAQRVERFYASFNENVEVLVEQWNRLYREGAIDRTDITGDLADYINIAFTAQKLGYRSTNFRRLYHILSKLEAPLSLKAGNHDFHITPFARSEHKQGFPGDEDLEDLYAEHWDKYEFGTSNKILLKIYSLLSLIPRHNDGDDDSVLGHFFFEAAKEALAEDPFMWAVDEGMRPFYQRFDNNEVHITRMGNTYVVDFESWLEHFNYDQWRFEELHAPRFKNFWIGTYKYVLKQHVSGKGYRPEAFLYFLKQVEKIRQKGGNVIVAQHYPLFYMGSSAADSTPYAEDAIKGNPNWAMRLAATYFRYKDDSPVIDVVVSGHVHKWGEYDLNIFLGHEFTDLMERHQVSSSLRGSLELAFMQESSVLQRALSQAVLPEAFRVEALATYDEYFRKMDKRHKEFRAKLDKIYGKAIRGEYDEDPEDFFHAVHEQLWHGNFHLDKRTIVRSQLDPEQGYPGEIAGEFNADSEAYGRKRGTLYVNIPAVGPSSEPGFMVLTVKADGTKSVEPYNFYRAPSGEIILSPSRNLPEFRRRKHEIDQAWKDSHGEKPVKWSRGPDTPVEIVGTKPVMESSLDVVPMVTGAGEFGLEFRHGPVTQIADRSWDYRGWQLGGQLTLPLSDEHHSLFGLNNFHLEIDKIPGEDRLFYGGGLGLGLVSPIVGTNGDGRWLAGARLFGSAANFLPAPEILATVDDGKFGGVFVNFTSRYTAASFRLPFWNRLIGDYE